ncbi:MAG TPA: hypothetical protein VJX74_19495 [Blastocatellia bacterium]|nr:hypothetical protein [Blastocatellia bacterium]
MILNEVFNISGSLAIISIAGFAVQRTLELFDPLFTGLIFFWKKLASGKLPGESTDTATKTWLMAVAAFLISIPIPIVMHANGTGVVNLQWGVLDIFIGALAISAGSNGVNSVLKFGEFAKDARKIEVKPLPEVKVNPAVATIKPNMSIDLLASVAGVDNPAVDWQVLEDGAGGTVNAISMSRGKYTAPAVAGDYHVAAISQANPAATAIAVIKVA